MGNKLTKLVGSIVCLLSPLAGYAMLTLYIGDRYPMPTAINILIGWLLLTAGILSGGILIIQSAKK